jgi:hypothetical protein
LMQLPLQFGPGDWLDCTESVTQSARAAVDRLQAVQRVHLLQALMLT